MSSCDSSGEDFMGRLLRQLQQDYNQKKYVGWATEEEIAARQAEMERSVRKEVKIVTAQQEGGPSNPITVGFVQPQYDLSLKLSGTTPQVGVPQVTGINPGKSHGQGPWVSHRKHRLDDKLVGKQEDTFLLDILMMEV